MAKRRRLSKAKKGQITKSMRSRRKYYTRNRLKILRYGRNYYRKNKVKVKRRQKIYRRLTKKRGPFYRQNKAGGRYPRFKRFRSTSTRKGRRRSRR